MHENAGKAEQQRSEPGQRPDWEAPHVQLALLAEPWGYQKMIEEWTAALKFGPEDPFYAAKLKEAREKFEAQKRDFAEKEAKARKDRAAAALCA